jgi:hypothetical protein
MHEETGRQLWIEFEISRADPIANLAKFATGHQRGAAEVTFVSMVSSHVDRGRRNLAAAAVTLVRHLGLSAFQTALLPSVQPNEIKELNHLLMAELSIRRLPIAREIERAIAIPAAVHTVRDARRSLAG